MSERRIQRKLAAILCADVQGYSRLMGADEEGTLRALGACRKIFSTHITSHGGRVFGSPGDAILAEFPSVVDAVDAAVVIQAALGERNAELPPAQQMVFRIGVNLGDVMVEGDDFLGDGVNIAARLEALAQGGGICISGTAYDQVKNRPGYAFETLGEQKVKNIAEPVRAYRVVFDGAEPTLAVSAPKPPTDRPSIAVLAFDNLSGDAEQSYFSDGISEDILTDLSKISGLMVIARNSSFAYKGRSIDLRQVGRELGVRHLLEGSVRKMGDSVRITAQLIEAETGSHVWAERYDRKLEDIFAVQDEITEEIVTTLDVKLARGEQTRAIRKSLKNPQARDLFYQGLNFLNNPTHDTMPLAREKFAQAAQLEQESPAPLVGQAWSHWWDAFRGWSPTPPDSMRQAVEMAEKAVALGDTSGSVNVIRGMVLCLQKQHDAALAHATQAVEVAPGGANVLAFAAMIHVLCGEPERGRFFSQQAFRLSPVAPPFYFNSLGVAFRELGLYEQSIATLRDGVRQHPFYSPNRFAMITTLAAAKRFDEARAEYEKLREVDPAFSVESYARGLPFRHPEVNERMLENLRKAGVI